MNTLNLAAAVSLMVLPVTTSARAGDDIGADWPQWRGPDRTGLSRETGWSPVAHEGELWTKDIGFGHSSFAVANGQLFAMGYDVDQKIDVVFCLDPQTGQEQWTHTYPAEYWNEGHDGGTCTTPTVDGDAVFTSNREGKLFALRTDSGSVIWTHDMQSELGVTPPRWGFSGSPVVIDDLVVMNVARLAAYEKSSGAFAWISEKDYGNAYSTPIEYDYLGRPSVLVLNGLGLAVIDRTDGSEITFYSWSSNPARAVNGATPVIIGNRIFISAGDGCVMLEPDAADGLVPVWNSRVMRTSQTGCVLYEDHLYGFDASILKCIDLEGNEKWRERGIGLGAVVVVGGRLVIIGAKGELIIAEATPSAYIELSREKVLDGGACWATPVLSHGLIYARNSVGNMVCRDHRDRHASIAAISASSIPPPADPAVLPDAETLLARHVGAIGGADALRGLAAVCLDGRGERQGVGPVDRCDAELTWSAEGAFVWRFSSGLDFGYTPRIGWSMSQRGPAVLEDEQIVRLRETGDLHRMLAPRWGFATLETTETRVFDDRRCFVVAAEMDGGARRTLYFEVDSGLLAGQEGDDVSLWIFDDYRTVGGARIPMEWSFYDAQRGSMTLARFSEAAVGIDDETRLDPPRLITMMTRSPEEKERENLVLREKYRDLIGAYRLATGSMAGTPVTIAIGDGGIQFAFGSEAPEFLSEPDDKDRMFTMANPQIYLLVKRNADGDAHDMVVYAWGNEFGRLERVEGG